MYWLEEHLKGSENITSRKAVILPVQQTKREARAESGYWDGVKKPKEDVMVHSGSASPMNTTPSASPHLTTAPPLVPPSGGTTDQDQTQSPAKLLTAGLTSNSDLTQTGTPADTEQPVVTPAKALSTKSSQESVWSSAQTPTPVPGPVNGRTSGRKRTPKSCDCCGPNSTGHNVRTSGTGKGRGRGRVAGRDPGVTPKGKVDQLTHIKSFDSTKGEVNDEDKVQMPVALANTQSHTPVAKAVTVPLQEESLRNCVIPEKADAHKKEDVLIDGSAASDVVEKRGGDYKSADVRLIGTVGGGSLVVRGQGRGMMKAGSASNMEVNTEIKKGETGGAAVCSKTEALAPSVVQREIQDAHMHHGDQSDPSSVNCPLHSLHLADFSDLKANTLGHIITFMTTSSVLEFLESFYIKYGSFIPLSESDVREHLKKESKCDLSNSGLDIKREMSRYKSGLSSAPVAGFMVMYNKHTLRLEDLGTLEEQNWLNDQIINMYGELIMEATEHKVHFFNSFFHKQLVAKGYDGVKRWTKKVRTFGFFGVSFYWKLQKTRFSYWKCFCGVCVLLLRTII
ncbi:uncharacterized protein LOC102799307 [Neolamprologus brichardi]|uniref:uncharacterized protein LOC102799307 n=1 Tax=Neolamprologus brichardi TaxID=32507 RepID=UPI0016437213|nr:uncharacterized protein LOC102799307 [Neolamprologus brichardi]